MGDNGDQARDSATEAFSSGVGRGQMVVAAEAAGSYKDREPPPGYDGENAEVTLGTFEKNVRLWEFETDVPRQKRGAKLIRALSGSARMAVEEMDFD